MSVENQTLLSQALEDFRRARRQAAIEDLMARLKGETSGLLSYEDVRRRFRLKGGASRGLQDIPLDAVVGSVNRYADFTRSFLPTDRIDEERWANVEAETMGLNGLPAIEVYKIDNVYFVIDGNHRVSVARQLGATEIQAYVTEFHTKVPLTPDDNPNDLILKAEYAAFLDKTNLDELRPESNFKMTVPGRYWEVETQIEAHRFMMGQRENREVSLADAVIDWHDRVYAPSVQMIRDRGILRDFPERTEADLYAWILRHQSELSRHLGWNIDAESAALDLAKYHSSSLTRITSRVGEQLYEAVTPEELEAGPEPGQWRKEWLEARPRDRLFGNILVPISGHPESWCAADQALIIAAREQGQLYGLTVAGQDPSDEALATIKTTFEQKCAQAGVPGQLAIAEGPIATTIVDRARWVDLVVLHLAHPPGNQTLSRLSSGIRTLLHRCPRPVLTVPGIITPLNRALIAYDGSPKSQEALFIAAYLALHWRIELALLTVTNDKTTAQTLAQAEQYLISRNISATAIARTGPVADTILQTAADQEADIIIMGSYGFQPILEVVLGSSIDHLLREARIPLLICR